MTNMQERLKWVVVDQVANRSDVHLGEVAHVTTPLYKPNAQVDRGPANEPSIISAIDRTFDRTICSSTMPLSPGVVQGIWNSGPSFE